MLWDYRDSSLTELVAKCVVAIDASELEDTDYFNAMHWDDSAYWLLARDQLRLQT